MKIKYCMVVFFMIYKIQHCKILASCTSRFVFIKYFGKFN